jgi:hypothetical protein
VFLIHLMSRGAWRTFLVMAMLVATLFLVLIMKFRHEADKQKDTH